MKVLYQIRRGEGGAVSLRLRDKAQAERLCAYLQRRSGGDFHLAPWRVHVAKRRKST